MEYLFIATKDDIQRIKEYIENLKDKSNTELVVAYNRQAKMGIIASPEQIRYLLALRYEFRKRFGESPVYVVNNRFVGMTGIIELVNNQIRIKD